ncbi:MAG: polyphosphate kinase 1 [Bacteroidetes bacterium B1(2017)]|nr:MAG: polyphosphate kinase 1 [Bacteroidetes bacterium B1(2017)]
MIKERKGHLFKDREISWLHFNERVLQEAENPRNPLLERIKFLAIFSSNLDEFFRVRVAQIRRLQRINGKKAISEYQSSPDEILSEIQRTVLLMQDKFTEIYENQVLPELARNKIFLIEENQVNENEAAIIQDYFKASVLNNLFPVVLDELRHIPHMRDRSIYLAVRMKTSKLGLPPKHAIIEIPTGIVNRFFTLPDFEKGQHIILLENIIRLNLNRIFSIFDFEEYESYIIKITRDAEYEITQDDTEYSVNLLDKIQKSLKQRSKGIPTRFVYDESMPKEMLEFLIKKLDLKNVNLIPGGRYHNFKDFMDFPKVGASVDYFPALKQIPIPELDKEKRLFDVISRKDILLHQPYESFDYLIRLLREAAIDPKVTTILISLYRVAKHSNVVNALINAVKNGKKVVVLMELQARFDEESNIYWTNQLQEAGAQVHFGKAGQKVHCKICLIYRKEDSKIVKYAHLSTGNYNGVTARIYSDFSLFTKDTRITEEVDALTDILFVNLKRSGFKHLLVAPDFMKKQFIALIEQEASFAKAGKPAFIKAKMNSLVDVDIIKKLYEASNAGVKIQLIIRGICCLVPGIQNSSENIEVISIIDRFLEHARVYMFCNNGDEKIYLSSADWMSRNLMNRIECGFPVYSEENKQKLKSIFEIQWNDEVKARKIDGVSDIEYKRQNKNENSISSQEATFAYLTKLNTP